MRKSAAPKPPWPPHPWGFSPPSLRPRAGLGSEADEEGQVEGSGDVELVQAQGGCGEGQVHGEEVAGVHQELAGSPSILLLQLLLWGHRAHGQGCPREGAHVGQSPGSHSPPRC